MRGVGVAVTAIAVMTALTGCDSGASVGTAGERATTARAAEKEASTEVTPDAVRGDVRSAAVAAGSGRLGFLDTSKAGNPCRVIASLRTGDAPKRQAVDSVLAVLKARGWGQMEQMLADNTDQAWRLKKNGWEMILGAGKVPEGAGIVFDADASGKACGVPMPSRPAAPDLTPPEPPALP